MDKTMMHILPSLGTGGGQTAVYALVNGLTDYSHIIVTHKVPCRPIPGVSARFVYSNIYSAVENYKPDVLHFSGIISNGTMDVRRLSYRPKILWVAQTTGAKPIVGADVYAACSNFIKGATRWPGNTDAHVLPNAARDIFFKQRATFSPLVVGRHCRFSREKFAISYWENLHRVYVSNQKVRFIIIGDGDYRRTAWEEVRRLGMQHVVEFTGKLPQEAAARVIQEHFTVYYHHTRRWREGWSLAISEALAAGIPVVCDSNGGNSETVINNVTGYTVGKNDDQRVVSALLSILNDESRWMRMSSAAVSDATERMSVNAMCDRYRKILEGM